MKQITLHLICFVLLVTQLSSLNLAQTKPEQLNRPLEPGKPIERELTGGEVHSYTFKSEAGQFVSIIVEQRGIDVLVLLFAPDGKRLSEVDSPNGNQGPPCERLLFTGQLRRIFKGGNSRFRNRRTHRRPRGSMDGADDGGRIILKLRIKA